MTTMKDSLPKITSVFSLAGRKGKHSIVVFNGDGETPATTKEPPASSQPLNHAAKQGNVSQSSAPVDNITTNNNEKEILEEEDAAAVAASLDPNLTLNTKNIAEDNKALGVSGDRDSHIEKGGNLQSTTTATENSMGLTGNDTEKISGRKAVYTSDSILSKDIKNKLKRRRGKDKELDCQNDPTYVADESSESSDEYEEPLKRRLRRAPKRRNIGVLDTFTQHLQTKRPIKPRKSLPETTASETTASEITKNLRSLAPKPTPSFVVKTVADTTKPIITSIQNGRKIIFALDNETVGSSHEDQLEMKEKNIKQLKLLIKLQEEAIEKIRRQQNVKEGGEKEVKEAYLPREGVQGKPSTADVRPTSPHLGQMIVTGPSTTTTQPPIDSILKPQISSVEILPKSKRIKLVTYNCTSTGQTSTKTNAFQKPLLMKGIPSSHIQGTNFVRPVINITSKAAVSLNCKNIVYKTPIVVHSTMPTNSADTSSAFTPATSFQVKSPQTTMAKGQKPSTFIRAAGNVNMLRLPAVPQSAGNLPGVFLSVPIPNSTNQHLFFVPHQNVQNGALQAGSSVAAMSGITQNSPQRSVSTVTNGNSRVVLLPYPQVSNGVTVQQSLAPGLTTPSISTSTISTSTVSTPIVSTSAVSVTGVKSTINQSPTALGSRQDLSVPAPRGRPLLPPDMKKNVPYANEQKRVKPTRYNLRSDMGIAKFCSGNAVVSGNGEQKKKSCNLEPALEDNVTNNSSDVTMLGNKNEITVGDPMKSLYKLTDKIDKEAISASTETSGKPTASIQKQNKDTEQNASHHLLQAKYALKTALGMKDPSSKNTENGSQGCGSLSVLKNALKTAFTSEALKSNSTSAISTSSICTSSGMVTGGKKVSLTDHCGQPLVLLNSVATTVAMSSIPSIPSTSKPNELDNRSTNAHPLVLSNIKDNIAVVTTVSTNGTHCGTTEMITTTANIKPTFLDHANIKAKVLSQNGLYVTTSLSSVGLANTASVVNPKQCIKAQANKKTQQQLSGILVKLKDGRVRLVELSDPSKPKTTVFDRVDANLATLMNNKRVLKEIGFVASTNATTPTGREIIPMSNELLATNDTLLSEPLVTPSVKCSAVLQPFTPTRTESKVLISGNVPSQSPSLPTGIITMAPVPVKQESTSVDNKIAIINHQTLNGISSSLDAVTNPQTIMLPQAGSRGQNVGIVLGKQEKLIELERKRKMFGTFLPSVDDQAFTTLAGLSAIVDMIQEQTE